MNRNEQILAIAAATEEAFCDATGWQCDAVETQESLDDFFAASTSYAECSSPVRGEIAGVPFLAFEEVQVRAGDTRRSLSVLDFGDTRIALDVDLSFYA